MGIWRNCKYAPLDEFAKHCNKMNEGSKSLEKIKMGKNVSGKGYFGCARNCRFFEARV